MDEDKELVIPQNNLTVAIGYNKFLSLKTSRLGQFCDKANAVKKIGNRNMLKLDKVVKVVLPAFLKGYFREFNGQPSRQNFCKIDPKEIYHNAEIVLKILKERMYMSYDPNSLEAKKGTLGEAIIKKILEGRGWIIEKPADTFKSGASIVDFYCHSPDGTAGNFAEVKTQIAYPYGIEKAFCYSFSTKQIEAYKEYARKHGVLAMYIVDPEAGVVFGQDLAILEMPIKIDGREYPFDKCVEIMGGDFHYWHRNQFNELCNIPEDDLAELRKLFNINAPEKKEDTATAEPPVNEPEPQPVGKTTTDTLAPDISVKTLIERTAAKVGITTEILLTAILDCRQKRFNEQQAVM